MNVHTYYVHVEGITTDTHALIKDNLQGWGAVRYVVVNSIAAPGFVQYHEIFAPFGTFSPNIVVDMQGSL